MENGKVLKKIHYYTKLRTYNLILYWFENSIWFKVELRLKRGKTRKLCTFPLWMLLELIIPQLRVLSDEEVKVSPFLKRYRLEAMFATLADWRLDYRSGPPTIYERIKNALNS